MQNFHRRGQNFLLKKIFAVSKKFFATTKKIFVVLKTFFVVSKKIFVIQKKFSEFVGVLSLRARSAEPIKTTSRMETFDIVGSFARFLCEN